MPLSFWVGTLPTRPTAGGFRTLLGVLQWFYIFPQEGGVVFTVDNLYAGQALQIACVNGNWFGWHVVDVPTGAYDQVQSYDFK